MVISDKIKDDPLDLGNSHIIIDKETDPELFERDINFFLDVAKAREIISFLQDYIKDDRHPKNAVAFSISVGYNSINVVPLKRKKAMRRLSEEIIALKLRLDDINSPNSTYGTLDDVTKHQIDELQEKLEDFLHS